MPSTTMAPSTVEPSGQQRRSSGAVRAALLRAATQLFHEHGYAGASYKDIAVLAATSESVLYRHFGSKSNLLAESVLAPFSTSFEQASRRWNTLSPEDRRRQQPQVLAELYSTFADNHQLVRILIALAQDPREPDVRSVVTSWFDRTFDTLRTLREDRVQVEHLTLRDSDLVIRAMVALVMSSAALDDLFLQQDGVLAGGAPVVLLISDLLDRVRAAN